MDGASNHSLTKNNICSCIFADHGPDCTTTPCHPFIEIKQKNQKRSNTFATVFGNTTYNYFLGPDAIKKHNKLPKE